MTRRVDGATIVIVAYKPKPGMDAQALAVLQRHMDVLRPEGLVTDYPATLLKSSDGTLIEIFEWQPGAIDRAHDNPRVRSYWSEVGEVVEYSTIASVPEASQMFSSFLRVSP